jgi:hypothetical protein
MLWSGKHRVGNCSVPNATVEQELPPQAPSVLNMCTYSRLKYGLAITTAWTQLIVQKLALL